MNLTSILLVLFFALVISALAYLVGALSITGAIAATLTGVTIFLFGGWLSATLLIVFFLSSSALSRVGGKSKLELVQQFEKGSQRDHFQVLANGGVTAFGALMLGISGDSHWLAVVAGGLATVNADTWGTELGVLARQPPRLITTGAPASPGTSGAVSPIGLLATVLGAALIAGGAALGIQEAALFLPVTGSGAFGAIADSLLGASVQGMYFCPQCEKNTERHPIHSCGTATTRVRGWSWMTNDMVNFTSSIIGAALAFASWRWFS